MSIAMLILLIISISRRYLYSRLRQKFNPLAIRFFAIAIGYVFANN